MDHGLRGDFMVGVLACVVASPCTAPFMGAALAYALASAQAPAALAIFAALGLGLASPFLLMAFVPATARWLPRPGAWMETLKQLLAFPMYATVIWLLWVLGKQRGVDAMALGLLATMLLALGLWWFEKHRFAHVAHRALAVGVVLLSLLPLLSLASAPVSASVSASAAAQALPAGAERFTAARLAELRRQGTPVFLNVTADWCLTCKVNQRAVLERDEFRALLADTGTVYLVADYTRPDPAIARLLKEQRAVGVPMYVSYHPGGRSTRLSSVLSLATVARALGRDG
jgi:thiol:disulfide interchange protein DsbD